MTTETYDWDAIVNGLNQYSYVPGDCVVDLPLGRVFLEITRGYEISPARTVVEVTPRSIRCSYMSAT